MYYRLNIDISSLFYEFKDCVPFYFIRFLRNISWNMNYVCGICKFIIYLIALITYL